MFDGYQTRKASPDINSALVVFIDTKTGKDYGASTFVIEPKFKEFIDKEKFIRAQKNNK